MSSSSNAVASLPNRYSIVVTAPTRSVSEAKPTATPRARPHAVSASDAPIPMRATAVLAFMVADPGMGARSCGTSPNQPTASTTSAAARITSPMTPAADRR